MSWAREIFHVVCTLGCSCHLQEQEKAYFGLQFNSCRFFVFFCLWHFPFRMFSGAHPIRAPLSPLTSDPICVSWPMYGTHSNVRPAFCLFFYFAFLSKALSLSCMAHTLQCAMCKVQCAMAIFCLSWPWILQHQSHIRLNCTQPFLNYFLYNLRQLQKLSKAWVDVISSIDCMQPRIHNYK